MLAAQIHWAKTADLETFCRAACSDEELEQAEGSQAVQLFLPRVLETLRSGDWNRALELATWLSERRMAENCWSDVEDGLEAYVVALLGQVDESRARIAALPAGFPRRGSGTQAAAGSSPPGRPSPLNGDAAGQAYPAQMRDQGSVALFGAFGLLETVLGISATGAGGWQAAMDHFHTALLQVREE